VQWSFYLSCALHSHNGLCIDYKDNNPYISLNCIDSMFSLTTPIFYDLNLNANEKFNDGNDEDHQKNDVSWRVFFSVMLKLLIF